MENAKYLIELAKENDLIVTGGSDYHGTYRPEIKLGFADNIRIPYSIYQFLKSKLKDQ